MVLIKTDSILLMATTMKKIMVHAKTIRKKYAVTSIFSVSLSVDKKRLCH